MTPCIDVYELKTQSDESLDNLKLRIVVIGDLQNKYLVWENLSQTSSIRTLKWLMADAVKHKAKVNELDFIDLTLTVKSQE